MPLVKMRPPLLPVSHLVIIQAGNFHEQFISGERFGLSRGGAAMKREKGWKENREGQVWSHLLVRKALYGGVAESAPIRACARGPQRDESDLSAARD